MAICKLQKGAEIWKIKIFFIRMNKDLHLHFETLKDINTLIKIVRLKAIKSDVKDIYNKNIYIFK